MRTVEAILLHLERAFTPHIGAEHLEHIIP